MKKTMSVSLLVFVAVILSVSGALAGTYSSGGITVTTPDFPLTGPALMSCEPWLDPRADDLVITGAPIGSTILVRFAWSSPYYGRPIFMPATTLVVNSDPFSIPIVYPTDTTLWPVWNQVTNERAIAVAGGLVITKPDGVIVKFSLPQWWVRCLPPPPPFQGCTPGYWRQDQHFDSWVPTGYAPGDDFNAVFGVTASFNPHTLLDAVWLGGGGEFALARHAVAALLNAAHPGINYHYTVAEVIAGVQNAYLTGNFEPFKTLLDFANNAGCPLN